MAAVLDAQRMFDVKIFMAILSSDNNKHNIQFTYIYIDHSNWIMSCVLEYSSLKEHHD